MYDKFDKFGLGDYPPEIRGRFNSFITTQFDDSLSVEMQIRSIIKWAVGNFDETVNQTNHFIDFINDLIEYMNEFIETFDGKYQQTILNKMQEWYNNGELETLINESLDTKYNEMDNRLTTQMGFIENEIHNKLSLRSYQKTGFIDFSIFEGLNHERVPCNVYSNSDGTYSHDYEIIDEHYDVFYISKDGQNSLGDGKTPETAWLHLYYAIQQIEADTSVTHAKIIFHGYIDRDIIAMITSPISKKYIFDIGGKTIGSKQSVGEYTLFNNKTYHTTVSHDVFSVFSQQFKDSKGYSKKLLKTISLTECQYNDFSYYHSGTDLYINLGGAVVTDENTFVDVGTGGWRFNMEKTAEVILRNVEFINGGTYQPMYFNCVDGIGGRVIIEKMNLTNTRFASGSIMNGIMTNNILDTYLFDVHVRDIPRDGFNYHTTVSGSERGFVLEFNCSANNVGMIKEVDNNNISSAHDGIHIVRVNTDGNKGYGPLIADVNGCMTLNIGVNVSETQLTNDSYRNAGFSFNDAPSQNWPAPNGKAWLIDCSAGSESEWGIHVSDNYNDKDKLFIRNFKGVNIPNTLEYTLMS